MTAVELTTPSDTEITLTRTFDAPAQLVFDAWTKPDLLKRWYGRHGWNLIDCEVDLRVGGAWRFVNHGPDGRVMIMFGVYREIDPPTRLVYTERFEGNPHESVITAEFIQVDGRTTWRATDRYESREARDAMLETAMVEGVSESFERLDVVTTQVRISDRYRRFAGRFGELVAMVPDGAWSNPSPCEKWDTRDVVRHNIEMAAFTLDLNGLKLPAGAPSVDDDPVGAWRTAQSTIQDALDDPEIATREHAEHPHLGKGPWNAVVDRIVTGDLVMHVWDLARAAGLPDEPIDAETLATWREGFAQMPDEAIRHPEVFGPALEAPPGSDEQTQFLAFIGRKAW